MPDGAADEARTLRTADALVAAGLIAPAARDAAAAVARRYAVAITPAMRALIPPGIAPADDPIGRQFMPDPAELVTAPHENPDPIGDEALSPIKGVVHRYADRALLKPLLVCPVYCRFCFRREQVGPGRRRAHRAELQAAYDWLRARPAIREVILTGGDPLMLSPRRLRGIVAALSAIPHVETLRMHTRVPVADPARVTEALADALATDKPLWLVVHANHAREFTAGRARRAAPGAGAGGSAAGPVGVAARGERQRSGAGGAVPRHAGRAGEAGTTCTSSILRPARRGFTCRSRRAGGCWRRYADG